MKFDKSMDWLKESDEIDVLAEDDLDIMQERGGSDYMSFYDAFAKEIQDNDDLDRAILRSFKLTEELSAIAYCIDDSMTKKEIEAINKRSGKIFTAIVGLLRKHRWANAGFINVIGDIANRANSRKLKSIYQDYLDEFATDVELHTDEPVVMINMIVRKLSDIINNGKRYYDDLERSILRLDDHGFKANKAAVLSELKKAKNYDVDVANKILSLVKQEWPNGIQAR